LAAAKTKEEALQQMRLIWFAFVVSIALYVWIGETMPGFSWLTFRNAGKTFVILAVLNLLSFTWAFRKRYIPARAVLRSKPEDIRAVKRWTTYWLILLCNANSLILFGLAFRLGDKTLWQSLPFYVVGSLLILSLWPRQVWSSTATTVK
jgi:hypothetical protein